MIQYKIDAKPVNAANTHIKDMSGVLKEIATTYKLLLEATEEQKAALSSPSIDAFRRELQQLLGQGVSMAQVISDYSEKLVVVSEQASKHLTAFEEHFSTALQKHTQNNNRLN